MDDPRTPQNPEIDIPPPPDTVTPIGPREL